MEKNKIDFEKRQVGRSKETYNYKGWLVSENFIKRCFAVFGHDLFARLIIFSFLVILISLIMGLAFVIRALYN